MKFNHKRMTLNKMKCNLVSYYLGVYKKMSRNCWRFRLRLLQNKSTHNKVAKMTK